MLFLYLALLFLLGTAAKGNSTIDATTTHFTTHGSTTMKSAVTSSKLSSSSTLKNSISTASAMSEASTGSSGRGTTRQSDTTETLPVVSPTVAAETTTSHRDSTEMGSGSTNNTESVTAGSMSTTAVSEDRTTTSSLDTPSIPSSAASTFSNPPEPGSTTMGSGNDSTTHSYTSETHQGPSTSTQVATTENPFNNYTTVEPDMSTAIDLTTGAPEATSNTTVKDEGSETPTTGAVPDETTSEAPTTDKVSDETTSEAPTTDKVSDETTSEAPTTGAVSDETASEAPTTDVVISGTTSYTPATETTGPSASTADGTPGTGTSENTTPSPTISVTPETTDSLEETTPTPGAPLPPVTNTSTSSSSPASTTPGSTTLVPTESTSTPSHSTATTAEAMDFTTETTAEAPSTAPTSNTIPPSGDTPSMTVNPAQSTTHPTETTSDVTTENPPNTTQNPVIECPSAPCPLQSSCLNGTCQCISGSFLQNGHCTQARVFPGQLHLASILFQSDMANRSSKIFQDTAAGISSTLRRVLESQPGFIRADVVQLQQGSVQATVNNVFGESAATQDSVNQAIDEAIKASHGSGLLSGATFSGTNVCDQHPLPCDVKSTGCSSKDGRPTCFCKEGYITNFYSNRSCEACLSGSWADGDVCRPCAFGHAGFNCNDSALLAVVVISCVLGGVLLILVLSMCIYCIWSCCSRSNPNSGSSPYPTEDMGGPWPVPGITPIPRATTNWETTPSMEMTEGGSTRGLVDRKGHTNGGTGSYDLNPDSMKTFKGKNPSRYSYLVQGHENPYFLPGEDNQN